MPLFPMVVSALRTSRSGDDATLLLLLLLLGASERLLLPSRQNVPKVVLLFSPLHNALGNSKKTIQLTPQS